MKISFSAAMAVFVSTTTILVGCSKNSEIALPPGSASSASHASSTPKETTDPLALGDGVLDANNLTRYGFAAMDFVRKDDFSPGFADAPLVGRRFKVVVPFDKHDSSLSYYYDVAKETFTVTVYPTSNAHEGSYTNRLDYLILQKNSFYGEPTPMSNAFGATKSVTPASYRVVGIGSPTNSYMGVIGKMKASTPDLTIYTPLSKTVKLSPDAARTAASSLMMDVEGIVVRPKVGSTISCSDAKTPATLTYAYQESWQECVISVKLARIAVRSNSTGIIAEWPSSGARH